MTRFAVAVDGDVTTRAAHSLSTHPGIEVVLLAPATSRQFDVVDSPAGCRAVVGTERALRAAQSAGLPAVTAGDTDGLPGVAWASLPGLALALAAALEGVDTVAVALPGEPEGSREVVFPSPIDARRVRPEAVDSHTVWMGGGDGSLAAALSLGGEHDRVILDDHLFMSAIALAAGAVLLVEDQTPGRVAVWERSEPYLRAVTDMGLVLAEREVA
ncbi:MAG: hypothetical protein ACLFWM_10005 [Actinomycetota bacterium]